MNRWSPVVIRIPRLLLLTAVLAAGCDGGPGGMSSYQPPTAPSAATLSLLYSGTETLVSLNEHGACSSGIQVGFSQHSTWGVVFDGNEVLLNWDPASGNDVIFRGTLSGDAFSAEYRAPAPAAGQACPPSRMTVSGTLSSDRSALGGLVVDFYGSGPSESRAEWRLELTKRK